MGFHNLYERIKEGHDDETSDYFVNIALKNNGIISDAMFQMADLSTRLRETLPELGTGNPKYNYDSYRRQNGLYQEFRRVMRFLYVTTRVPVMVNKPSEFDKKTLNKIKEYIDKPYGSFRLSIILDAADDYVGMLEKKGLTPVVIGYSQESGMKKWLKS